MYPPPSEKEEKEASTTFCQSPPNVFKVLLEAVSGDFHGWSHRAGIRDRPLQGKAQVGLQLSNCCVGVLNLT